MFKYMWWHLLRSKRVQKNLKCFERLFVVLSMRLFVGLNYNLEIINCRHFHIFCKIIYHSFGKFFSISPYLLEWHQNKKFVSGLISFMCKFSCDGKSTLIVFDCCIFYCETCGVTYVNDCYLSLFCTSI